MITLKDVSKKYGDLEVLDRINLSISNNKIVGLLGVNGSRQNNNNKIN